MIRESPSSGLGGQVGLQCDCSETCQFSVWYDTSGCRRQVVRLWSIASSVVACGRKTYSVSTFIERSEYGSAWNEP